MQNETKPRMPRYRQLSASDEALINRVLEATEVLLQLHREVETHLRNEHEDRKRAATRIFRQHNVNAEQDELDRFLAAEPMRWAAMAKTDIQRGCMALIRALEQPSRG